MKISETTIGIQIIINTGDVGTRRMKYEADSDLWPFFLNLAKNMPSKGKKLVRVDLFKTEAQFSFV